MKNIKKVLIVCTGNSCRSKMAEGYLKKRLKELGMNMLVSSAGTGTVPGMTPTNEAIDLMREGGMDISGYLSSNLNKMLIDNSDLILVMEPHHKEKVLDLVPEAKDKIRLLKEFSTHNNILKQVSIEDPIGKPIEFYKKVFEIIKDSLEGFLKWLKK